MTFKHVNTNRLIETAQVHTPVSGLTHSFYRYPARFAPRFARAAIEEFTEPGEIVLDPFSGGGTTLVEASALGRRAIGVDVNSLAIFVSNVKTTPLSRYDISKIRTWIKDLPKKLNLHRKATPSNSWRELGYQRNISDKQTWPIRKTLELALFELESLENERQRQFIRCVLLKTGQWALDCKRTIVSAGRFRDQLLNYFYEMLDGIQDYRDAVLSANRLSTAKKPLKPTCFQLPASRIDEIDFFRRGQSPRLVLTSPPYPGVHILYHRWQVGGRKETPAPYWIAGCVDGHGASQYTFGNRNTHNTGVYYDRLRESFDAIIRICDQESIVIQIVGFSNPDSQMQQYLKTLKETGLKEFKLGKAASSPDGRLWRSVPNRRWHATKEPRFATHREVVLFHRVA